MLIIDVMVQLIEKSTPGTRRCFLPLAVIVAVWNSMMQRLWKKSSPCGKVEVRTLRPVGKFEGHVS